MNESIRFKKEVLNAFQKVTPSKINIEDDTEFKKYINNHYNLFFHKLKFPPELFNGKKILDFGCGTGEVDIVMANWGGIIEGFDFNERSVRRANDLRQKFNLHKSLHFCIGDVDSYEFQIEDYDIVQSMGVIAHVPNRKMMFERMASACKKDGFVILGYVEKSGLIQRLFHRAICMAYSGDSEDKIHEIAKKCFGEHIERSVKYGGRTAESVINDYLINPHYHGLNMLDLLEWAKEYNLEFYSSWPEINIPFCIDSPYFLPISKHSELYRKYISLLQLRWIYAQAEDTDVFGNLFNLVPFLDTTIQKFVDKVDSILQEYDYNYANLAEVSQNISELDTKIKEFSGLIAKNILDNLHELNSEIFNLLKLITEKTKEDKDFNLDLINHKLFQGYNGLGTSYIIFHKLLNNG